MTASNQARADLAYVRDTVERREHANRMPLRIAALWAAFTLIGFVGLDFKPAWAGPFLLFGAPIAYLLSRKLGADASWRLGEQDARAGQRHALHWGASLLAIAAVFAFSLANGLSGMLLGQMILLVVGLTHLLAAVHFRIRLFGWSGAALLMGGVAMTYVDRWGWTALGVLLAASFIAASLRPGRGDG